MEIDVSEVLGRLTPAARFEWELRITQIELERARQEVAPLRARVAELEAALDRAVEAAIETNGRSHESEASR